MGPSGPLVFAVSARTSAPAGSKSRSTSWVEADVVVAARTSTFTAAAPPESTIGMEPLAACTP